MPTGLCRIRCHWTIMAAFVLLATCMDCDACFLKAIKNLKRKSTSYLGCYADQKDQRDLKFFGESSSTMTLDKCKDMCEAVGAEYYGAQSGTDCYCGSTYGAYGKNPDEYCDRRCMGSDSKSEICGGDLFNSVYSVK